MESLKSVLDALNQASDVFELFDDKKLKQHAQNTLLDYIFESQKSLPLLIELDDEISKNAYLAKAYNYLIDDYISGAPSYTKDDGWMKVSGFTFFVNDVQAYTQHLFIPEFERARLRKDILRTTGFEGDIKVSSLAYVFPLGDPTLPSMASVFAMEEKTNNPDAIGKSFPTITATGDALVVLSVYIFLAGKDRPDITDWMEFDEDEARVVEAACAEYDIGLNVPEISVNRGECLSANGLLYELGLAITRTVIETFIAEISSNIDSNHPESYAVEFVMTNLGEVKTSQYHDTDISIRIRKQGTLAREFMLLKTGSPGFVIGYLQVQIDMLRPDIPVKVIDLREDLQ